MMPGAWKIRAHTGSREPPAPDAPEKRRSASRIIIKRIGET